MALFLGLMGVGIGLYGTLIGAGGGVVLVPLLLYLYPEESPRVITTISLIVVFLNAFSGTIAYHRLKRIDYKTGLAFSAATVPGAILGVLATFLLSREVFQIIFGIVLTAVSIYIFWRPGAKAVTTRRSQGSASRCIVDREGTRYEFAFDFKLGIIISLLVGFAAGLLGIGGGVIHVPAMVGILCFPAHIATATSHFVLVVTTFFAIITHMVAGDLAISWGQVIVLGAGVILGAQIGARLSSRVGGKAIVRLLAVALLFLGIRLLWVGH